VGLAPQEGGKMNETKEYVDSKNGEIISQDILAHIARDAVLCDDPATIEHVLYIMTNGNVESQNISLEVGIGDEKLFVHGDHESIEAAKQIIFLKEIMVSKLRRIREILEEDI